MKLAKIFRCGALFIAGTVLAVFVNNITAVDSQAKAESTSMPLPLKVAGTQILNSKKLISILPCSNQRKVFAFACPFIQ